MLTFATAVILLLLTPGPGVLSTAGVGSAFGPWRGILYVTGLFLGTNAVAIAVISGLSATLFALPFIRVVLMTATAGYLGYLAVRIALAGSKINFINAKKARHHQRFHVAVDKSKGLCREHDPVFGLCLPA